MVIKMQDVFSRVLGVIIVLYAFLMLDMPSQYGFGLADNSARFIAIIMLVAGVYITVRK